MTTSLSTIIRDARAAGVDAGRGSKSDDKKRMAGGEKDVHVEHASGIRVLHASDH